MSEKILEIRDLTIQYKTRKSIVEAVNHIDLDVEKGKTLGLVGETGAGKTTTALGIMQLIPDPPGKIASGEIIFEGQNLIKCAKTGYEKDSGKTNFHDFSRSYDSIKSNHDSRRTDCRSNSSTRKNFYS